MIRPGLQIHFDTNADYNGLYFAVNYRAAIWHNFKGLTALENYCTKNTETHTTAYNMYKAKNSEINNK